MSDELNLKRLRADLYAIAGRVEGDEAVRFWELIDDVSQFPHRSIALPWIDDLHDPGKIKPGNVIDALGCEINLAFLWRAYASTLDGSLHADVILTSPFLWFSIANRLRPGRVDGPFTRSGYATLVFRGAEIIADQRCGNQVLLLNRSSSLPAHQAAIVNVQEAL